MEVTGKKRFHKHLIGTLLKLLTVYIHLLAVNCVHNSFLVASKSRKATDSSSWIYILRTFALEEENK